MLCRSYQSFPSTKTSSLMWSLPHFTLLPITILFPSNRCPRAHFQGSTTTPYNWPRWATTWHNGRSAAWGQPEEWDWHLWFRISQLWSKDRFLLPGDRRWYIISMGIVPVKPTTLRSTICLASFFNPKTTDWACPEPDAHEPVCRLFEDEEVEGVLSRFYNDKRLEGMD